jgi:hypothetical protein
MANHGSGFASVIVINSEPSLSINYLIIKQIPIQIAHLALTLHERRKLVHMINYIRI